MTCSGLELKTDQTAVSKHVGIRPKNKGGGVVIMPRFGSRQSIQQQSLSAWLIV